MRYTCTISDTGYTDVIIPMRSFQIRYRQSPQQCYVQAVIPKGVSYAEDIIARQAGEIAIHEVDDDDASTELLTANIDNIRLDEGATNRSVTITGYKQVTWSASGSSDMPHVTYLADDRVRGLPVTALRPGDEVTAAGETFTADEILWTVNSNRRQMQVSGRIPRMLQIRLAAAGHMGLSATGILRPSSIPLAADAAVSNEFQADLHARMQAAGTLDLSATATISLQALMQANATLDMYAIPELTAGSMPSYIQSLSPKGYWRLTEDSLTTFENLGTLGSAYDATLQIWTPFTGHELDVDPQHAACVPALPLDKGLWVDE